MVNSTPYLIPLYPIFYQRSSAHFNLRTSARNVFLLLHLHRDAINRRLYSSYSDYNPHPITHTNLVILNFQFSIFTFQLIKSVSSVFKVFQLCVSILFYLQTTRKDSCGSERPSSITSHFTFNF